MSNRIKIEKLLLLVAALLLCALLIVRVTFAWFSANTSVMTVVTGNADLDVTFYRLRDFNRDGAYNFTDYVNDVDHDLNGVGELTNALKNAGGIDAITAENFDDAFAALSEADMMRFAYETDFSTEASGVNMGSRVVYRVRVANNSPRAASLTLSFGNMMSYYYNADQMTQYINNGTIDDELGGENGLNIHNYAAKFLFSIEHSLSGSVQSIPLWSVAQGESAITSSVAAGASTDIDFSLVFDGQSSASDYLTYISNEQGECYTECLDVASTLGVPDPAAFTTQYVRAMYDDEMTYLFSTEGGSVSDITFRLSSICILGELVGQDAGAMS